jgi:hypothetical protein
VHKHWLLLGLLVALLAACANRGHGTGGNAAIKNTPDPRALTTRQAAQHIGEQAKVCGKVASAHYARDVEGRPTFLDLDKPYPNPIFTIVVWGDYRERFSSPPDTLRGLLCVTGLVTSYRGEPQIVVINPSQITR